jgi:hypothetical protein
MNKQINNYIFSVINKLSRKFPEVSFVFGFDRQSNQYIIDINPSSTYSNELFMEEEFEIMSDFSKLFPSEQLLIISNDPHIKVKTPILIKYPLRSYQNTIISKGSLIANSVIFPAPSYFNNLIISSTGEIRVTLEHDLLKSENFTNKDDNKYPCSDELCFLAA